MANTMRVFSLLIVCLILVGLVLVGVVWMHPQKRPAQAQKSPPPQTTADARTLDKEVERAQNLVIAPWSGKHRR
jgi:hypothetical protein